MIKKDACHSELQNWQEFVGDFILSGRFLSIKAHDSRTPLRCHLAYSASPSANINASEKIGSKGNMHVHLHFGCKNNLRSFGASKNSLCVITN